MNESTAEKISHVKQALVEMGNVLVAYSGGTDSTLLAAIAHETLGEHALAVMITGPVFTDDEVLDALSTARQAGFSVQTVNLDLLSVPDFASNPPDRCYHCRQAMLSVLQGITEREKLAFIIDGSNYDDMKDYRPGMKAAIESGVRSPFVEAGLTKDEIRAVSQQMGLPTWNKPASPCLASRIPYGTPVTPELIRNIAEGERYLHDAGFTQVRVRYHGTTVRIEIVPEEMGRIIDENLRPGLVEKFKTLGYSFITLDLAGYRTGSLNIGIRKNESTSK